jgi:phage shock protein A
MFNQMLQQMKELTEQLQKQSIQLQQQTEQLTELQEIIEAKDAQIAALECVSKCREMQFRVDLTAFP